MPYDVALGYLGWSVQSAAGTPVAPASFVRWKNLAPEIMLKTEAVMDGFNLDASANAKLGAWWEGKFGWYLTPDAGIQPLIWALGGSDDLSGAGDPYQHVVESTTASPPYMTVEYGQQNGAEVLRITDCRLTDFEIPMKAGEIVLVNGSFLGRIPVPGQSNAVVNFDDDRLLTFADAVCTFSAELDIAPGDISELTISVKRAVDNNFTLGSITPHSLIVGKREWALKFNVIVPDTALYREIFFGSAGGTVIENANVVLGSLDVLLDIGDTPDHSVEIELQNVVMTKGTPTFSVDGKTFMIAGEGYATIPDDGSPVCTITALNARSSVYLA